MSLLRDENRVSDAQGICYTPVMMSRAAKIAAGAARTAKNSPAAKQARTIGKSVVQGVAEEFGKQQAKDIAEKTWKKGRVLLKKTPDRSTKSEKPVARQKRFWEITDAREGRDLSTKSRGRRLQSMLGAIKSDGVDNNKKKL